MIAREKEDILSNGMIIYLLGVRHVSHALLLLRLKEYVKTFRYKIIVFNKKRFFLLLAVYYFYKIISCVLLFVRKAFANIFYDGIHALHLSIAIHYGKWRYLMGHNQVLHTHSNVRFDDLIVR